MNVQAVISKDAIFITGEWTLPISKDLAIKIFGENYQHGPNDGLFPIDGTSRICLSISPVDIAKIALTESDIYKLKQVLGE